MNLNSHNPPLVSPWHEDWRQLNILTLKYLWNFKHDIPSFCHNATREMMHQKYEQILHHLVKKYVRKKKSMYIILSKTISSMPPLSNWLETYKHLHHILYHKAKRSTIIDSSSKVVYRSECPKSSNNFQQEWNHKTIQISE